MFELTRSRVRAEDIEKFSPNDPGYPDYVRVWTEMLTSGVVPQRAHFDLSEVIGLTSWANADIAVNRERFQVYRRFVSAVAVVLVAYGNEFEEIRPSNYLTRDLIIGLDLADEEHVCLVRKVLPQLEPFAENEMPFLIFGQMVVAQLVGDFIAAEAAASRLIEAERVVRSNNSINFYVQNNDFLFGLTNYNQLNSDWHQFSKRLTNPNQHEDTQLVIEAVLQNADGRDSF